jgi:hypothetical protein
MQSLLYPGQFMQAVIEAAGKGLPAVNSIGNFMVAY